MTRFSSRWVVLTALTMSALVGVSAEYIPLLEVGSNKTEVVTFNGYNGFRGKLVIGDGDSDKACGIVYAENSATITNIASTSGEWLLGRKGYAHLGLSGNATYYAQGVWFGGYEGPLGISIVAAKFLAQRLKDADSCSFSLGGDGADVSLYIGEGGLLDYSPYANETVYIPRSKSVTSCQVTVDAGSFLLGTQSITANRNAVFNLNQGGIFQTSKIVMPTSSSSKPIVQFDGGTWRVPSSETLTTGEIVVQVGGGTIEVAANQEAVISDLTNPVGYGLDAIDVSEALAKQEFEGPPVVRITSSSGRGATAVCEYDSLTKKVTGFKVTGRGFNYKNAEVRLYYGGDNQYYSLQSSDITLGTNYVGSLVKTGLGSLKFTGKSTYKGLLSIDEGTVYLAGTNRLDEASSVRLDNESRLDLMGNEQTLSDFKSDGSGVVTNGILTLTGLKVDIRTATNQCDILNMNCLRFAANAKVRLENFEGLDPSRQYVIYNLTGELPGSFPLLDEQCYSEGLERGWSVVLKENQVLLVNVGGSMFIYY